MRLAIAILISALVVLSGCAVQESTDTTDSGVQEVTLEEVTVEDASLETDTLLLEENEIDIGEML